MPVYKIDFRQNLPISPEKAWSFLSDPKNLKVITPDFMGFDIISGAERSMYPGQIIQYSVSPLWGIKTKWITEITHIVEGSYFVDEQRFGPYAFWHHKHFLTEIKGGVRMDDVLHYKLPYGFLGSLAHPLLVRPKLKQIFEYRKNKLIDIFGSLK